MYNQDSSSFFKTKKHEVYIIEDLSISVHEAEIVALVGASGSGKTLLADALMGMYEPNVTVKGNIWFDGVPQDAASLAALRGKGISLVPQSINHLDPLMKVGKHLASYSQKRTSKQHYEARVHELLERYRLDSSVLSKCPFELSGGMARRALLMMALLDEPQVIIADEPTPGLDLELAIKAMEDFRDFANEGGGVLLITHDIELALRVADRVAVFKGGTVVEETAVANFSSPTTLRDPFSKQLWHALPEHDFAAPIGDSLQGASLQGAPQQGASLQGAPQQGASLQGAPSQGAPQQGALQQDTFQQGAPSQGAPQQGAPQQDAFQQGTPSQGGTR